MKKQTKELNRINNELDKQINAENQEAFTDIICYLRGANISEYNQELIRHDLTDMVLSAQERGENIKIAVGGDYKVFCDNIIESLPPISMKEKALDFLDIIFLSLSILCAINIIITNATIELIHNFVTGKPLNFQIPISVGSVISIGLITVASFIILEVILKNSFKIGKNNGISNLKIFLISASIMALLIFIAYTGRSTLFTVNIFVACIFTLSLYIIHQFIDKFLL